MSEPDMRKEHAEIQEILIKNQGFQEMKTENEYLKNQLLATEKKANQFQNSVSLVILLIYS